MTVTVNEPHTSEWPGRKAFSVAGTYLNCASRHPLPTTSTKRLAAYAGFLGELACSQEIARKRDEVRDLFATLVAASSNEIAIVPSTTYAENLVVAALGLVRDRAHIVTDELHFSGSLAMYRNLQEAGCEVTILAAKGGTIPLSDMEAALTAGARFVAVSATSSRNGHEYDLAALSELAHRHGALVYADIIQTAGASPIDLKLAGVDFAGCGAYKWLMGDMGLGFLYVREGHHACLAPPVGGGEQFDNASGRPRRRTGAAGLFEVGTVAASVLEALLVSLPALIEIGPAQVAEARQPVLRKIRHAGTALGLRATTPQQSRSPILAFEGEAITPALLQGLAAEHISVAGRAGWLRISVSTFNDEADIDHLAATIERCLQGSR